MSIHSILICDPLLPPPGGNHWPVPWLSAALQAKGCPPLSADSSAKAVEDASFDLMSQQEREMLDEVRLLPRRALLEILCHPVSGQALVSLLHSVPAVPVPVPDIDISPLLRMSLDWQGQVATALDGLPTQESHAFAVSVPDPPAFDLGALAITTSNILPP